MLFCWAYGAFKNTPRVDLPSPDDKGWHIGKEGNSYGWCLGFRSGRDLYASRAAEKNNM